MAKNNYFDEVYVTKMLTEYQKTAITEKDENGKDIVLYKDANLEHLITLEVMKIAKAIIQFYRYYIFEPYDDCLQHATMSCFTNYLKWHPSKGTAFNFFSIISKRSLLNYTERKQKHRNHSDIDDHLELHSQSFGDFDFFIDNTKDNLFSIVNENYVGIRRKRFLQISEILCDYLIKTQKYISKSDFYSWGRSYGIRSIDVREYVKEINKHSHELFELV